MLTVSLAILKSGIAFPNLIAAGMKFFGHRLSAMQANYSETLEYSSVTLAWHDACNRPNIKRASWLV